ncbi:MAG: ribonuclease HII [Spirochaetales bacterium]|nr:MAG: ribonuclease HII [Spirochaetales bacterium]
MPSFGIERELFEQGYRRIAGVDEVGRGALAGPLCLGLVIYSPDVLAGPPAALLSSVNDSKKLTHSARLRACGHIHGSALCVHTAMASHRIVDRLNVNGATQYLLSKILTELAEPPDVIIMDGRFSFSPGVRFIAVKGGDSLSISIASASIAAKIHRDGILDKFELLYPGYGFKKNKGYGTLEHRESIGRIGPSPVHRRSFAPLRDMACREDLFAGHED